MAAFIIVFVVLTLLVGYFVNKAANRQDQQMSEAIESLETHVQVQADIARTQDTLMQGLLVPLSTVDKALLETFGEAFKNPFNYRITGIKDRFSIRMLIQNLQLAGLTVTRVNRNITEYPNSVLISLISQGGAAMLMRVDDAFEKEENVKSTEIFKNWKEGEESGSPAHLWMSNHSKAPYLFVDPDCDEKCSLDDLISIRKAAIDAAVEMVELSHSASKVLIQTITRRGDDDTLHTGFMSTIETSWQVFTHSYPGNIKFAANKSAKISSAVGTLLSNATKIPFNLAIDGETGFGKTSFIKYMVSKLAATFQAENAYLNIIEWKPSCTAIDPVSLLLNQLDLGKPVLLVVEDFHLFSPEKRADVLNLLDGIQTPPNLYSIVSYNPKELDSVAKPQVEALTRPGRSLHLSLQAIDKADRNALVEQIRKTMDADIVEVPGAVEALPEKSSVAQIWACFRKKTIADIID